MGIHTPFDNEGQLNEEEFVEEETIHGLGEEPFQFDSSGNIIAKFSNFVKNEIGRGEDGHSKAQAAAYHSSTKETFSHDTQAGHSDPVDDINGSLSQFGSTTLNHLLSETMGNVDTENNQCGETLEAEREITADVETAIVESIATSEDREQFINEISDIYKDHYFKKESLGGLYDFLLHLMGSKKALKRADEKLEKAKKQKKTGVDYEKLVKSGKSMSEQQAEDKNNKKSETDYQKKISVSTEVMTAKGEWVDIAFETGNSLKTYRIVVTNELSDFKDIHIVNNLTVANGSTSNEVTSEAIAKAAQAESETSSTSVSAESSSTESQSNGKGTTSSSSGGATGGSGSGGSGY